MLNTLVLNLEPENLRFQYLLSDFPMKHCPIYLALLLPAFASIYVRPIEPLYHQFQLQPRGSPGRPGSPPSNHFEPEGGPAQDLQSHSELFSQRSSQKAQSSDEGSLYLPGRTSSGRFRKGGARSRLGTVEQKPKQETEDNDPVQESFRNPKPNEDAIKSPFESHERKREQNKASYAAKQEEANAEPQKKRKVLNADEVERRKERARAAGRRHYQKKKLERVRLQAKNEAMSRADLPKSETSSDSDNEGKALRKIPTRLQSSNQAAQELVQLIEGRRKRRKQAVPQKAKE